MVVAKHDRAHRALAKQFHDRHVRKEYLALVWGAPRVGTVYDTPIGRDPNDRKRMSGRARHGRAALTEVVHTEPFRSVSLVRLSIGTGRTHQIRVHLAAVARLDRPWLHAERLVFEHPVTGATIDVTAPLPPELQRVLNSLRAGAAGGRS